MTMVIDGSLGLTFPDTSKQYNSYYNFKNRIINGAMVINQRGGTVTAIPSGAYGIDRFKSYASGGGVFTSVQSTTVPTGQGFINSALLTVTTADSSIAAPDYYAFNQEIEGFNVADLGFGTASASTVTLSFWVRSSVTGTYAVALYNSAGNRGYPATYTISSANTWTFISLTIPGDTGGTWLTDNSAGLIIRYDLGSGSDTYATANTWKTTGTFAASRTSSTANWIATNGATFYITGVQLEKGSTATSFDYRPYGTELALCQRYAQLNTAAAGKASTGGGAGAFYLPLMVQMRAAPTVTLVTGTNRVDQTYTSQRTITAVNSTFGNDTAGTAISAELAVTSLGANSQCTVFGGSLLLSSEL